jgi:hypothetical protein
MTAVTSPSATACTGWPNAQKFSLRSDRFERLTTLAVLYELEARAKWLAAVAAVLG